MTGGCVQCCNEHSRQWRVDHVKDVSEYNRDYGKKWREANAELIKQKRREKRLRNLETVKLAEKNRKRKRRAREFLATGSHTAEDILIIYEKQEGKCPYCPTYLNGTYHIDHKIPLSRGGTNDKENVHCTCGPYNLKKAKKTHEEFLKEIAI